MYAAEMGITLFSEIDRYTLEDAKVELFYHLRLGDRSFEKVPMGIFEVGQANRTLHYLEIKANAHRYSVSAMCKVLQIPRSTYYYEAQSKRRSLAA